MKHPSSLAAYEVAEVFSLLSKENRANRCNMGETKVNVCGTVACHGGWFAVANYDKAKIFSEKHDFSFFDYDVGSAMMAKHLGFKSIAGLEKWADENPTIWGNKSGVYMFSSYSAFGLKENPSLGDISRHWKRVAKRLWKLEQKVK